MSSKRLREKAEDIGESQPVVNVAVQNKIALNNGGELSNHLDMLVEHSEFFQYYQHILFGGQQNQLRQQPSNGVPQWWQRLPPLTPLSYPDPASSSDDPRSRSSLSLAFQQFVRATLTPLPMTTRAHHTYRDGGTAAYVQQQYLPVQSPQSFTTIQVTSQPRTSSALASGASSASEHTSSTTNAGATSSMSLVYGCTNDVYQRAHFMQHESSETSAGEEQRTPVDLIKTIHSGGGWSFQELSSMLPVLLLENVSVLNVDHNRNNVPENQPTSSMVTTAPMLTYPADCNFYEDYRAEPYRFITQHDTMGSDVANHMDSLGILERRIPHYHNLGHHQHRDAPSNGQQGHQSSGVTVDLCAAPGGKTMQLVDAAYSCTARCRYPDGAIIANEKDMKKAIQQLPGRLKKHAAVNTIVTRGDGTTFPTLLNITEVIAGDHSSGAHGACHIVRPDHVLCDVPCSGDGTVRKHPAIAGRAAQLWRNMRQGTESGGDPQTDHEKPDKIGYYIMGDEDAGDDIALPIAEARSPCVQYGADADNKNASITADYFSADYSLGLSVHAQRPLLKRAIEMVKAATASTKKQDDEASSDCAKGGYVVYSTCSLNPLEDECVVLDVCRWVELNKRIDRVKRRKACAAHSPDGVPIDNSSLFKNNYDYDLELVNVNEILHRLSYREGQCGERHDNDDGERAHVNADTLLSFLPIRSHGGVFLPKHGGWRAVGSSCVTDNKQIQQKMEGNQQYVSSPANAETDGRNVNRTKTGEDEEEQQHQTCERLLASTMLDDAWEERTARLIQSHTLRILPMMHVCDGGDDSSVAAPSVQGDPHMGGFYIAMFRKVKRQCSADDDDNTDKATLTTQAARKSTRADDDDESTVSAGIPMHQNTEQNTTSTTSTSHHDVSPILLQNKLKFNQWMHGRRFEPIQDEDAEAYHEPTEPTQTHTMEHGTAGTASELAQIQAFYGIHPSSSSTTGSSSSLSSLSSPPGIALGKYSNLRCVWMHSPSGPSKANGQLQHTDIKGGKRCSSSGGKKGTNNSQKRPVRILLCTPTVASILSDRHMAIKCKKRSQHNKTLKQTFTDRLAAQGVRNVAGQHAEHDALELFHAIDTIIQATDPAAQKNASGRRGFLEEGGATELVSAGVRGFQRYDTNYVNKLKYMSSVSNIVPCVWRIAGEAAHIVGPLATRRIIVFDSDAHTHEHVLPRDQPDRHGRAILHLPFELCVPLLQEMAVFITSADDGACDEKKSQEMEVTRESAPLETGGCEAGTEEAIRGRLSISVTREALLQAGLIRLHRDADTERDDSGGYAGTDERKTTTTTIQESSTTADSTATNESKSQQQQQQYQYHTVVGGILFYIPYRLHHNDNSSNQTLCRTPGMFEKEEKEAVPCAYGPGWWLSGTYTGYKMELTTDVAARSVILQALTGHGIHK